MKAKSSHSSPAWKKGTQKADADAEEWKPQVALCKCRWVGGTWCVGFLLEEGDSTNWLPSGSLPTKPHSNEGRKCSHISSAVPQACEHKGRCHEGKLKARQMIWKQLLYTQAIEEVSIQPSIFLTLGRTEQAEDECQRRVAPSTLPPFLSSPFSHTSWLPKQKPLVWSVFSLFFVTLTKNLVGVLLISGGHCLFCTLLACAHPRASPHKALLGCWKCSLLFKWRYFYKHFMASWVGTISWQPRAPSRFILKIF